MDADTIVKTVLRFYADAEAVYLFGTHGTEHERPESDVDIAILFPYDSAPKMKSLSMSQCRLALSEITKKDVDLINLRQVNTVLQKEVIMNGRIIYQRSEKDVDYFEMAVMSAYQKLNEERAEILREIQASGRILNV